MSINMYVETWNTSRHAMRSDHEWLHKPRLEYGMNWLASTGMMWISQNGFLPLFFSSSFSILNLQMFQGQLSISLNAKTMNGFWRIVTYFTDRPILNDVIFPSSCFSKINRAEMTWIFEISILFWFARAARESVMRITNEWLTDWKQDFFFFSKMCGDFTLVFGNFGLHVNRLAWFRVYTWLYAYILGCDFGRGESETIRKSWHKQQTRSINEDEDGRIDDQIRRLHCFILFQLMKSAIPWNRNRFHNK